MSTNTFILLVSILALMMIALVIMLVYQRKLIREINQVAKEAEQSKNLIIAEQRRNQQLKQEMTNNIAHELKTPVSGIRGYLEILLGEKPVSDDKRRYFLDRCYQQTLRLSSLINDVSLINKLEEADDLFPLTTLNLYDIAQEAIRDLEENISTQNDTIVNHLPTDSVIQGNTELVYAIFRNLIENAISYAGERVTITIETYKEAPDAYYIHFFDTGCGVDNKYLDRIFDRFLRIEEGRSRKSGGTGLGLSIVKHAVLFHQGTIYCRNRNEGGLEYFLSLSKENTLKK